MRQAKAEALSLDARRAELDGRQDSVASREAAALAAEEAQRGATAALAKGEQRLERELTRCALSVVAVRLQRAISLRRTRTVRNPKVCARAVG